MKDVELTIRISRENLEQWRTDELYRRRILKENHQLMERRGHRLVLVQVVGPGGLLEHYEVHRGRLVQVRN